MARTAPQPHIATQSPAQTGKKVYAKHPQWTEYYNQWKLVRDAVQGEAAIKAENEIYLPRPNPEDKSPEATARYAQYKQRAVWRNATGRTLEGLVGHVFRKESASKLTPRLELIRNNIDGTGQTLEQLGKLLLARTLSYGRTGLLADYPELPEGKRSTTVDELDKGHFRPKLVSYSPFKIINWCTAEVGARAMLNLVVLEEDYAKDDDGFESDTDTQYRVLRLNTQDKTNLIYSVEIWRKDVGREAWSIVKESFPKDHKNQPWREIPFQFIGWQENTPTVNSVPLYDLAILNVHEYMVSADYYESVFLCGQPTPVFSGLTKDWVKEVFPKGTIVLGSRAAVPLPKDATASLLQAEPNNLAKEALDGLKADMVALGAQLVHDSEAAKTATEERNDSNRSTSVLASSANNVSDGVTQGLRWCGMFIGEEDKSTDKEKRTIFYDVNTDFDLANMSSQERAQLLSEWQGKGLTTREYRAIMVAAGIATADFDKYMEELEADSILFPEPIALDKEGNPLPTTADKAKPGSKLGAKGKQEPHKENNPED